MRGECMDVAVWLFDGFETLDAFGPVEILGRLPDLFHLHFLSMAGGIVHSRQQVATDTVRVQQFQPRHPFALLLPGGMGTRQLVDDGAFLAALSERAMNAAWVLSVCTGSALLGRAGLLDHKKATTNKRSFDWVVSTSPQVDWQRKARWVRDGSIYTSSGISAGMDMTLGFLAEHWGVELAEEVASQMEYLWNRQADHDPFAMEDVD